MAGGLLDIGHRGALADEVTALIAQRVPRYERARPPGPQAGRRLVHPFGGRCVAHRIRLVHQADEALEQQAADDQVGEAGHQDPADPACRPPPDPPAQQYRPRRPRPISRKRQKTAAAMNGEATTSGMLYSVTPISLRISYCQYCPSAKATANRTAALMKKVRQAHGRGRRESRSAKARQMDAAHTPSP